MDSPVFRETLTQQAQTTDAFKIQQSVDMHLFLGVSGLDQWMPIPTSQGYHFLTLPNSLSSNVQDGRET